MQDGAPDKPQVEVQPGQRAGAEGLLGTVAPAPATKPRHLHMLQALEALLMTDLFRASNLHPSAFVQVSTLRMRNRDGKPLWCGPDWNSEI